MYVCMYVCMYINSDARQSSSSELAPAVRHTILPTATVPQLRVADGSSGEVEFGQLGGRLSSMEVRIW